VYACVETGLCVEVRQAWRGHETEYVSGVCSTDADCPVPGERCVTKKRCDPLVKRAPVAAGAPVDAGGADEVDEVDSGVCQLVGAPSALVAAAVALLGLLGLLRRRQT
jgi:hypothetical protein